MERRIKLSNSDLRVIADSLFRSCSEAVSTKPHLDERFRQQQEAFIEQTTRLEEEFRSRIEEEEDEDED